MSDQRLIVPGPAGVELEVERRVGETTCPAATDGHYGDTGRRYIHCGVSGDHYAVARNVNAAAGFCCGEYTACPVWQAARAGREDVDLAEHRRKVDQRRTDRLTERQITAGVRRDDRGLEAGQPVGEDGV